MKHCLLHYAQGIFLFVMSINAQGESRSTLQDLITFCNENGISNCERSNTNDINDMIVTLNDAENRIPLNSKFASERDQSNGVFQIPFGRTWRDQLGQLTWSDGDKIEKLQFGTPYNYDTKRGVNSFSSWGGKRGRIVRPSVPNDKRPTVFSSWGGKRTQKFFNWGGKRSVNENQITDVTAQNSEHNIMKRNAVVTTHKSARDEKEKCATDENNVEELFKEFMNWSRKQSDQKKGSIYRKMFGISVLRGPDNLSRRADSFFQWGGKRNGKQ